MPHSAYSLRFGHRQCSQLGLTMDWPLGALSYVATTPGCRPRGAWGWSPGKGLSAGTDPRGLLAGLSAAPYSKPCEYLLTHREMPCV